MWSIIIDNDFHNLLLNPNALPEEETDFSSDGYAIQGLSNVSRGHAVETGDRGLPTSLLQL